MGEENQFSGKQKAIWGALILAACILYSTGISHESVWFDETYSLAMAQHSFSQIISLAAIDNHPPLYYLLLHIVIQILGTSPWALRFLSVLSAVLLVSLGAGPVRRLFDNRTTMIYAVLALFTPGILIYAHETRMYAMVICTVTAATLYGFLAIQHNRIRDWVLFGIAALTSAYLHYFGLIAIFYLLAYIILWALIKKRAQAKRAIITAASVFIAYIPWLFVFYTQITNTMHAFWITEVTPIVIMASYHSPFSYKYFYPDVMPWMSAVVFLCIGLIIAGLIITRIKKDQPAFSFILFVLLTSLLAINTPIFISRVLTPVFHSRYTIVFTGMLLLLLAACITQLPGKYLQIGAILCFCALNTITMKNVYTEYFNDPIKEIYTDLHDEINPGDLLITSDAYVMGPLTYYFPDAEICFAINPTEAQWSYMFKPFENKIYDEHDLPNLLNTHDHFWYVSITVGFASNVNTVVEDYGKWEQTGSSHTYSTPYTIRSFSAEEYTVISE